MFMLLAPLLARFPLCCSVKCAMPINTWLFVNRTRNLPVPLPLLNNSAVAFFAQHTRIPTSGFYPQHWHPCHLSFGFGFALICSSSPTNPLSLKYSIRYQISDVSCYAAAMTRPWIAPSPFSVVWLLIVKS